VPPTRTKLPAENLPENLDQDRDELFDERLLAAYDGDREIIRGRIDRKGNLDLRDAPSVSPLLNRI